MNSRLQQTSERWLQAGCNRSISIFRSCTFASSQSCSLELGYVTLDTIDIEVVLLDAWLIRVGYGIVVKNQLRVGGKMDEKTKGAWLLAQSKSLDAVNGAGRLENIQYAGRTGRLFNLLRRTVEHNGAIAVVPAATVQEICRLNNIDRASRETGLAVLGRHGRIEVGSTGDVAVLGATSTAVLESTTAIFEETSPSREEKAVVHLSEKVSERPDTRSAIEEYVSDTFEISRADTSSLIDVCRSAAILDQEEDKGLAILFNNNTFRSGEYAAKAFKLMQGLTASEHQRLSELQLRMQTKGAVLDLDAQTLLGGDLYRRVVAVGLFDRLEVSNSTEAVGYLTSPDAFQKFGKPFEEDPVDDAKALLASLTYGMTRSDGKRGAIAYPDALLRNLIHDMEVGGRSGVEAIGEDYRELERRQVVKVIPRGRGRFAMKLLKRDVGELARNMIKGNAVASQALLLEGAPATNFNGPADTRRQVRQRNTLQDNRFVLGALDRLRSGG